MRSRFTEMWVAEPAGRADLEALVAAYLLGTAPQPPIAGVVDFYLAAKAAAVRPLSSFLCIPVLLAGLMTTQSRPGSDSPVPGFHPFRTCL